RSPLKGIRSLEIPAAGHQEALIAGNLVRGERIYSANCATCHGPAALGGDLGPSLTGKAILAQPLEYERIVRQGLRRMPGFQAVLNSKDQVDVRAWLRSLTYPTLDGPSRAGIQ